MKMFKTIFAICLLTVTISPLMVMGENLPRSTKDTFNSLIARHGEAKKRYNTMIDDYNSIWVDMSAAKKAEIVFQTKATDQMLMVVYFETMACLHSSETSELGKRSCAEAESHLIEIDNELSLYEQEFSILSGRKI